MPLATRRLAALLATLSLCVPTIALAQLPPNMRMYHLVLLRKGPAWSADASEQTTTLERAHAAHLERLEAAKSLLAAGAVDDSSELAAVLVLDTPSKAEAERLIVESPAVKANRLVPQVLEWYAEKGIGSGYLERRAARPGEPVAPQPHQFGLLMRGPNTEERTKERAADVQKGHIANLEAMHAAGLLVAAGPFGDGGEYRGVVVFRAKSWDEVFEAVAKDPAIRGGRLVLRLYRWGVPEGVFAK